MLSTKQSAQTRPPTAAAVRHSIRTVDGWLRESGLNKIKGATLGFGPFTWFGRRMLGDKAGIEMHERLQALADRGAFGLRSLGWHYLVLGQKPGG